MSDDQRFLADAAESLVEMSYGASMEILEMALGGSSSHSGSSHGTTHGSSTSHGSSSHESGGHEGGTHLLFGSLELLDSAKWSISLLIVVAAVLLIEGVFHLVHIFTEDSPFHKVISALEKELMIVGVTAFMFKIILTSISNINEMWKFSLEIADLIIPLFSFTNCFISLILIFRSVHHCDSWSKAVHLKAAELLDEYVGSPFRLQLRRWFPAFSKLVEEIEFQFMHHIFCQQYSVQRKAFAFDEYASLVYERLIQHIIELRLYHWVVLVALLMFYWIPNRIVEDVYSCHDSGDEHYCLYHGATILLIIFGCALLFTTFCFAIASRLYLRAILQQNGLLSVDDYPEYLQLLDKDVDAVHETKRLGEDELKSVIQAALKDAHHLHGHHHHHHHQTRLIKEASRWMWSTVEDIQSWMRPNSRSVVPSDIGYNEDELRDMINASFKNVIQNSSKENKEVDAVVAEKPSETIPDASPAVDVEGGSPEKHELDDDQRTHHKNKHNTFKHGHLRQIKDIFLFQNPTLYFEGVQMLLLPISLYFAVWMVEFSVYKEEAYLKFISLFIGALSIALFMYVVKGAALLKAMYHIDKDAMLEVIEQTEGSRLLGETIREKLLQRLSSVDGDAYSTLRNLFDEIDKNRSNKLSRVEFEILMDRLEVNFSRKKWKQIYHEIDRNYDDEISFDEFFIFLFPNHDFATANELKRLKIVRSRIVQRQAQMGSAFSFFRPKKTAEKIEFDNIREKAPSQKNLLPDEEANVDVPKAYP